MEQKEIFCKIIELPTHQILLKKVTGDDDNDYEIQITTMLETCEATITAGFPTEESMNEAFDNYNEESAKKFVDTMNQTGF